MATDDYKDYDSNSNHYNDMHHLRRDAGGGPWQCHIGKMAFHFIADCRSSRPGGIGGGYGQGG